MSRVAGIIVNTVNTLIEKLDLTNADYDRIQNYILKYGLPVDNVQAVIDHMENAERVEKIVIDPHNCSREEYAMLIMYLSDNCWDFKKIKSERL